MGHCQILPPLPTPSGNGCGWHSTGAYLGICRHGNYRTRASCWWFSRQPSFDRIILIRAVEARILMKRSCRNILNKAWSWRGVVLRGAPVNWPGTKVPINWGFYKIWSTRPSPRPNLRGRNCPLSAMGVKVSLVCSNSTVFLHIDIFSQYGEVINSINPRDSYMHHWPGSPLTQVMA